MMDRVRLKSNQKNLKQIVSFKQLDFYREWKISPGFEVLICNQVLEHIDSLGACRTYDNLLRKTWIWPYFVPPRKPSGRENSTTIRLKRPQNLTQISFSRFHSLSPTDSWILFLTRHTGCCSPRAYSSSPNGIPTNNCRAPRRNSMMKNHGMKSGSRPTCT